MHPVLVDFGRFHIYSYGFMLAFSFFVGVWLAGRRSSKAGVGKDVIYDLTLILIVAAVLGSRALYILTHKEHFRSFLDIIALWQGGATYYGGFLLALVGAILYVRKRRVSFLLVADICSPSIALGVLFTRIGCFLSGCCFGSPTGSRLGLVFPSDSPAGFVFPEAAIHPTQLYSAFYGLVIFIALLLLEKKKSFKGFTFGFLCILYGLSRFAVDFFRYYEDSAGLGGVLEASQVLSLGLLVAGVLILLLAPKRAAGGG